MNKKSKIAKTKIRHEALNLFKKQGYNKTTVKEICQSSGYSVGAFYHHYDSKSSILDSTYQDFDDRLESTFQHFKFKNMTEAIYTLMIYQTQSILKAGVDLTLIQFSEQLLHGEKFIIDENRYQIQQLKKFIEIGIKNKEFKPDIIPIDYAKDIMRLSIGDTYVWCLCSGNFDLLETVNKHISYVINEIKI